jgi:hypothetical protein
MSNVKRTMAELPVPVAISIKLSIVEQVKEALLVIANKFEDTKEYLADEYYHALRNLAFNEISDEMYNEMRMVWRNSRLAEHDLTVWAIRSIVSKY